MDKIWNLLFLPGFLRIRIQTLSQVKNHELESNYCTPARMISVRGSCNIKSTFYDCTVHVQLQYEYNFLQNTCLFNCFELCQCVKVVCLLLDAVIPLVIF